MQQEYIQEDEITLKELILKIQEYYREVVKNWKWVVFITIPFVAWFLYKAMTTPDTYTATLTYMVNEDEGGNLGGVSSILSQFGLGGGGNSDFNLDKIVQLSKSRRIINAVLLEKAIVGGKEDYLANHIMRIYSMHKYWKKSKLKDFWFNRDTIDVFSRLENIALKAVYGKVVGASNTKVKGLFKSGYSETSGILTISIRSESEDLSKMLAIRIYENLSLFYIDKSIEKQRATYNIVREKRDSIESVLNKTQYLFLKFDDANKGVQLNQYRARKLKLQRDLNVQSIAYAEVLKNLEIADFALKRSTPFFQAIDVPVEPIPLIRESKLKALLLGSFIGGFLSVFFLVVRKLFRDAMR